MHKYLLVLLVLLFALTSCSSSRKSFLSRSIASVDLGCDELLYNMMTEDMQKRIRMAVDNLRPLGVATPLGYINSHDSDLGIDVMRSLLEKSEERMRTRDIMRNNGELEYYLDGLAKGSNQSYSSTKIISDEDLKLIYVALRTMKGNGVYSSAEVLLHSIKGQIATIIASNKSAAVKNLFDDFITAIDVDDLSGALLKFSRRCEAREVSVEEFYSYLEHMAQLETYMKPLYATHYELKFAAKFPQTPKDKLFHYILKKREWLKEFPANTIQVQIFDMTLKENLSEPVYYVVVKVAPKVVGGSVVLYGIWYTSRMSIVEDSAGR